MKHTATTSISTAAFALVLSLCAACGGGGGDAPPQPKLSGTILFLPDPSTVPQPAHHTSRGGNASVDRAQPIGLLTAGDSVEISGKFAPGAGDLEAFSFVARERVAVRATLVGQGASGADLLVYDPVALQYVARGAGGEVVFVAHGACDLVVRGSEAGGSYTLAVSARDMTADDLDSTALPYLGALSAGDAIQWRTRASAGAQAAPRSLVTVVERLLLDVEVESGEAGTDVVIRDVTSAGDERELAAGTDSVRGVEVAACTLLAVEIRSRVSEPDSSDDPITVRIAAIATPDVAIAPATAARFATRSQATLEQELVFDPRARPGSFYGAPRAAFVPGQVLVAAEAGAEIAADVASRGARVDDAIPGGARLVAFDLPPAMTREERARATIALASTFEASPRVRYSELNVIRRAYAEPNDAYYPLQWHYPLIHLQEAWDVTTGSDDVIVAIVDTGQTEHPDLVNRQIAGYDFISDSDSAADGDGIDADPTDVGDGQGPQPSSFHGTHVAGTVGAETNNSAGVAGVTWATKLMHLRVLGKDGGNDFDIANAVRYAARLPNNSQSLPPLRAQIVNLSLGGPDSTQTMQNAVNDARNQGLVLIAAAGNQNTSQPSFPGAYSGVISVAAVDINAHRAPYSNFGSTIDIAAPGGNTSADLDDDGHPDGVLSTLMDDSTDPLTPVYAFYDGTSMATPHVSGVAALMLAVQPGLTPAEVEGILIATATDLGAPGRDDLYGHGLIHAYAAVLMASGGSGPNQPLLSLTLTSLSFGAHQTDLSVGVMNIGNGTLDVTGVSVETNTGSWLSASTVPSSNPAATNVGAVNVHVDRSGLADALYTGSVKVSTSNGGDQTIQVTMVVQNIAPTQNVELFVLAVDATTFETLAQTTVNPATGLGWGMFDLPPGNYILVCGSDDDQNDLICDDGDLYCGLYPTLNDPQPVGLGSSPVGGLDFTVSALGTTSLDVAKLLRARRAVGMRRLH